MGRRDREIHGAVAWNPQPAGRARNRTARGCDRERTAYQAICRASWPRAAVGRAAPRVDSMMRSASRRRAAGITSASRPPPYEEDGLENLLLRALLAGAMLWPLVLAADYPEKPVRMIVPFAPGGGVDTIARVIGPRLSE